MSRKFERPVTAQAAVLKELRRRITRGEVLPGQAIRQEVLASELGVSRLPVREALVVLQSERLVDYTQHKGYVVAVLDEDDLAQTYELRQILEDVAIDQAMDKLTDDDLAQMRKILDEMLHVDPSTSKSERIEANRAFHFTLFSASANNRLISLLSQLWDTCDRYRALYYPEKSAVDKVSGHKSIIDAAEARDGARLKELLTERREWAFAEALRVVHAHNERARAEIDSPA